MWRGNPFRAQRKIAQINVVNSEKDVISAGILMPKPQFPPRTRIFVGGLLYTVSKRDIESFFRGCGEIYETYLAMDQERGGNLNRGFCYVQFLEPSAAACAIKEFDGRPGPGGRKIGVKYANA